MILQNFKSKKQIYQDLSLIQNNQKHLVDRCFQDILSRHRLFETVVLDGTTVFFDDRPVEEALIQSQPIRFNTYYSDVTELLTASVDELREKLNEFLIYIPFSKKRFRRQIELKSQTDTIRSTNQLQEKFFKYIDRVRVLCCFNDSKYFNYRYNPQIIKNMFTSFAEDVTSSDFTFHAPVWTDLSTFVFQAVDDTIFWLSPDSTIQLDVTGLLGDFTMNVPLVRRVISHDATTLDRTVGDQTDVLAYQWRGLSGFVPGLEKWDFTFDSNSFLPASHVVVPTMAFQILGRRNLVVFNTISSRSEEWLSGYPIPYGDWLWSALTFHYGFDETTVSQWLRLAVALVHHRVLENAQIGIFSSVLKLVSGTEHVSPNLKQRNVAFDLLSDVVSRISFNEQREIVWNDKTVIWNLDHIFSGLEVLQIMSEINRVVFVFCFESDVMGSQNLLPQFSYYAKDPSYGGATNMTIHFTVNNVKL